EETPLSVWVTTIVSSNQHRAMAIYVMSAIAFKNMAPTESYFLSLHDALPIWRPGPSCAAPTRPATRTCASPACCTPAKHRYGLQNRKSTRLNSSYDQMSYAVLSMKKKITDSIRLLTCTSSSTYIAIVIGRLPA